MELFVLAVQQQLEHMQEDRVWAHSNFQMIHSFLLDYREPVIRSTKRCQTDFQPGETHAYEKINQQQTASIVTKGNYT